MALIAFLPNGIGTFGTGYGIIANQEYGMALYGGMDFAKVHSFEMRFSTGPASLTIKAGVSRTPFPYNLTLITGIAWLQAG